MMNIKKIIKEEMDDFDWVRDVSDEYTPKKGDKIEVIDIGDRTSYLQWLGGFSENFLNGLYSDTIKGRVLGQTSEKLFVLSEEYRGDNISFPILHNNTPIDEYFIRVYPGLKLKYKIL